jgi:hypothetical protein
MAYDPSTCQQCNIHCLYIYQPGRPRKDTAKRDKLDPSGNGIQQKLPQRSGIWMDYDLQGADGIHLLIQELNMPNSSTNTK